MEWWIVVNDDNTALAVYGSALAEEARIKCKDISRMAGFGARVIKVTGERPRLGDRVAAG